MTRIASGQAPAVVVQQCSTVDRIVKSNAADSISPKKIHQPKKGSERVASIVNLHSSRERHES